MSLISKAEHEHLMRKKLDGSDLAGMFRATRQECSGWFEWYLKKGEV